ncbi:MAG: PLP-dependent aminotransferase family protein [Spirochaetales bacterium]|nr:PLP-dependent aminotransferase family protein [Spirochaetales bacterium]
MSRSIIRELLKLTNKPEIISFAGGLPSPQTFPSQELKQICISIFEDSPQVTLQYSATEGLSSLRDMLVDFTGRCGLPVSREELIVTTASQQSLDLVGKIFIDWGDLVVVEEPSYLGAVSAFKAYGVRFMPIPMDEQGIETEVLHSRLRELKRSAGSGVEYYQNMPKFIYTIPDFQNPSGITMSLERREQLLNIADEFDLIIVEDVPYKWLRYRGEELPLIGALEAGRRGASGAGASPAAPANPDGAAVQPVLPGRRVINLFTFSKILSPGIRLGWICADAAVIDKLVQAKQAADLCTSALTQAFAEQYMRRGLLEGRIQANIELYRGKLRCMLESLEEFMPRMAGLSWTAPEGGMFIWITLPEGMDTEEMFKEAIERNVAYVVGSAFHPAGGGHNTMRLNFSYCSEEEIREGIRRLAGLVRARQRGAA